MTTEKVFFEWLTRLEEGAKNYAIHKNNDWLEQMQISRKQLKKIFREQQMELADYGENVSAFESLWLSEKHKREKYEKAIKDIVNLSPSWSSVESYTNTIRIAVKSLSE